MKTLALTSLLLATCLSLPAAANPQKSNGVATGCWTRGGFINKVRIGHTPWKACAKGEQELKLQIQDVPNMRERHFALQFRPDGLEYIVLDFERFIVSARCSPTDGTQDFTYAVTGHGNVYGGDMVSSTMPEDEEGWRFEHFRQFRATTTEGKKVILSIQTEAYSPNGIGEPCMWAGIAKVFYFDETMTTEEWGALEDSWNAQ